MSPTLRRSSPRPVPPTFLPARKCSRRWPNWHSVPLTPFKPITGGLAHDPRTQETGARALRAPSDKLQPIAVFRHPRILFPGLASLSDLGSVAYDTGPFAVPAHS